MRFFARRVLRPVHALPRRHRQGAGADGSAEAGTSALLEELSQVMSDASICGLGQAAPNPVDCVMKYFPQEVRAVRRHGRASARSSSADAADRVQAQRPHGRSAAPTRPIIEAAQRRTASRSRTCATRTACAPDGNCRACVVEIEGERVLAPSCCRSPDAGHGGHDRQRARARSRRRWCSSCCCPTCPRRATRAHNEVDDWAAQARRRQAALRGARAAEAGPVASGDRGQPRRLHPVHALRARLPRGAGQRRHRLRLPRRAREDRVRPGRPDGRVAPASPAASACRPARPAR